MRTIEPSGEVCSIVVQGALGYSPKQDGSRAGAGLKMEGYHLLATLLIDYLIVHKAPL